MKIFVFIVIYNMECRDSITCSTLPEDESACVSVLDNSTISNCNLEYCANRNWKYISMSGNQGLSKAYNRALDEIRGEKGIVVWFDDDTHICSDYFIKLRSILKKGPNAAVFLPIVKTGDMILSPSKMGRFRSMHVKALSDLRCDEITGINTGMAVRSTVYQDYVYDEMLFLDCVDHQFIKDMKRNNIPIIVMENITLAQRFFAKQKDVPWERVRQRFVTFKKDYQYFCRDTVLGRIYSRVYLLIRFIRLYLEHALLHRA